MASPDPARIAAVVGILVAVVVVVATLVTREPAAPAPALTPTATPPPEAVAKAEEVARAVEQDVQACFAERAKQRDPLTGAWAATWTVGADGWATDVTVTPEGASDRPIERCISRAIRDRAFPREAAGLAMRARFSGP